MLSRIVYLLILVVSFSTGCKRSLTTQSSDTIDYLGNSFAESKDSTLNNVLQGEKAYNLHMDRFYNVVIHDSLILSSIKDYISYYRLSPDSVLIGLSIRKTSYRTVIEINHGRESLDQMLHFPGFYSIIDNFIVLLYSPIDVYRSNDEKIINELKLVVKENNVRLDSVINIYEPQPWTVIKCEKRVEVKIGEYYEEDLPCGFRTEVKKGKIVVEKEEWLKKKTR